MRKYDKGGVVCSRNVCFCQLKIIIVQMEFGIIKAMKTQRQLLNTLPRLGVIGVNICE